MKHHWLVIDTLVECLSQGIDAEKLKFATFQLDTELDRRSVYNFLPIDEKNALNRSWNA